MQAYLLCFHDRELYCKFDSVESGRFVHSFAKSDITELISQVLSQKLVLEFQITAEQVVVVEPLLKMVMAKTLEHLDSAVEGLVSVEVWNPQPWPVAVFCL